MSANDVDSDDEVPSEMLQTEHSLLTGYYYLLTYLLMELSPS
jgi:hypothetical protein